MQHPRSVTSMTGTEWLNEEEFDFWRGFIVAGSSVLAEVDAALKADAGISFDDYEVLVHLSEADGRRLRMTDLSNRLLHSRNRLTQRIDRMAARGLVRREKCSSDGRGTFAVMTDDGYDTIRRAAPDHVRAVREHLIDRVGPDRLRSGIEVFDQIRPSGHWTEELLTDVDPT